MKCFCLMCWNLSPSSLSQEEGGRACYGWCEVKRIYKYSPYHDCAKSNMGTNVEGWHMFLKRRVRGAQAYLNTFEKEMSILTHEKRLTK